MGRLSNLASPIGALPARLGRQTDAEGHSPTVEPWRKWYNSQAWRKLAREIIVRDGFTCQCGCGVFEPERSKLVADHRIPHRGDPQLFWDPENLQTLRASPCHASKKQREERRSLAPSGSGPRVSSGRMARPSWFKQVVVPFTVVCGPPGAGKSTYVRQHARPTDRIICFDELATKLFGRAGEQRAQASLDVEQIAVVLRDRNEAIGDLMRDWARGRWTGAWLILTEPKAEHRAWWARTTGARMVVLATSPNECRRCIAVDAERGDRRGAGAMDLVESWWRDYAPASCDETIERSEGGRGG